MKLSLGLTCVNMENLEFIIMKYSHNTHRHLVMLQFKAHNYEIAKTNLT